MYAFGEYCLHDCGCLLSEIEIFGGFGDDVGAGGEEVGGILPEEAKDCVFRLLTQVVVVGGGERLDY